MEKGRKRKNWKIKIKEKKGEKMGIKKNSPAAHPWNFQKKIGDERNKTLVKIYSPVSYAIKQQCINQYLMH